MDLLLFALGGNLLWDVSLFNTNGILMVVEADVAVETIDPPAFSDAGQPRVTNGVDITQRLVPGTTVVLSALATSEGEPSALKYQWLLNGIPVTGATAATYTFEATFNTKGVYTVAATNEGGTTIAATAITILVDDVPQVTVSPSSAVVNPGATHTLQVSVGGPGPFTFQWYKDDQALPGAAAQLQNLVLSNISEANEGSYYLIVTNVSGSATSAEAFVRVRDPITQVSITVNPTDAYVSQTITFTAEHDGEDDMTYVWKLGETPIPGAPNARVYTITNAQLAANGNYKVEVSSLIPGNKITSNVINLNLKAALPAIFTPPASKTLLSGETLDLKVAANGLPLLRYIWKKNNVVMPNVLTADIGNRPALLTDGGSYIVEVYNTIGKATNAAAPAQIVVVDSGSNYLPVASLATATLTARVGADPKIAKSIAYKWQRVVESTTGPGPDLVLGTEDDVIIPGAVVDVVADSRITGVSTNVLKITKVVPADEGRYVVRVTGLDSGIVTGSEYNLRIFSKAPSIGGINFPDAIIGKDYSYQLPIDRDDPAAWPDKITASCLPPGLKLDPLSGLITGKPTATKLGGYPVKVTVANKAGKETPAIASILKVLDLDAAIPGVWIALVDRNPDLNLGAYLGGRVDLTVTTKASFTGTLTFGPTAYKFGGPLNVNGAAPTGTVYLKRSGKPVPDPLRLDFTLDPTNNTIASGTVTDGVTTVNFHGWRNIFAKTPVASQAAAYTGYYTMALELPGDSPLIKPEGTPDVPLGSGYAYFTVAVDGTMKVVGKMSDNETVGFSTFVGPNGQVAAYQHMYKALKPVGALPLPPAGGSLLGEFRIKKGVSAPLNPNNSIDSLSIDGTVRMPMTWVRPASTKATDRIFKAGFGIPGAPVSTPVEVIANGGRYDAPPAGKVVLDIPEVAVATQNNASVRFYNSGDLNYSYLAGGQSFTSMNPDVDVAVIKGSKATILKANVAANVTKTAITPVPKSGLISGSFKTNDINPTTPAKPLNVLRSVKFYGIIIREEGKLIGVGFYLLPQLPVPQMTTDKTSPYYGGYFEFKALPGVVP